MLSMPALLALLSVGIHSNWKRGRLKDKQRTLLYTLIAAVGSPADSYTAFIPMGGC